MAVAFPRRWLEGLWYPPAGAPPPPLVLRAAAALYGAFAARRAAGFDRGRRRVERLPVPCISVGNLTVGGSGKTPLVAWIVAALLETGVLPGVVSRGYGGRTPGPARVPATGGAPVAVAFGDEPALLAARFPGVPVIVGRDRAAAGALAAREGAAAIVADDAFQHRRLGRDLDIVAIDAGRGFGDGRLLPAGPLREPPSALARAGLVVLLGGGLDGSLEGILARHAPAVPVVRAGLAFGGWRAAAGGSAAELPAGTTVAAFAGIAAPERFRRTVEDAGLRVAAWEGFPDHHRFRTGDLRRLAGAAEACGAAAVVTTAKDAVRIGAWPGPVPLYRAEVELVIMQGREELWGHLMKSTAAVRG